MREYRIIGPPGTGKTTTLAAEVMEASSHYGNERVLVASLTRAAAVEVAGRGTGLPDWMVGTVHAHAYRSIDRPEIAETKLSEWNDEHPEWAIKSASVDLDGDTVAPLDAISARGEELYNAMGVLRSRMVPPEEWSPDLRAFHAAWQDWQAQTGRVDFAGMVELALREVEYAPGAPDAIFVDEAQDIAALEMALLRKWASHADTLVLVGDPWQNLYRWRGTDPRVFVTPELPLDRYRVLGQSYRVPRAVHAVATDTIARHSKLGAIEVEYEARDAAGAVRTSAATWRHPEDLIRDIETQTERGRSVMVLATCSYMLRPLIKLLREAGLPFHNPYRRKRADWNPLRYGSKKRVTGTDRVLSFLSISEDVFGDAASMDWRHEHLKRWAEILSSDVLQRGAKARLKGLKRGSEDLVDQSTGEVSINVLCELFREDESVDRAYELDLQWYLDSTLASRRASIVLPIRVALRQGGRALLQTPLITIGTAHSVKGGQADVVYVFPDLSAAGYDGMLSGTAGCDDILRLFYVAYTRAREELVLCAPASRRCFS